MRWNKVKYQNMRDYGLWAVDHGPYIYLYYIIGFSSESPVCSEELEEPDELSSPARPSKAQQTQ